MRFGATILLALGFVALLDRRSRRLGLDPPGFRDPLRRLAGLGGLACGLAVTALSPLGTLGRTLEPADFTSTPIWALFANHVLLLATAAVWFVAGYAGSGERFTAQVGLVARRLRVELGLGALFGIGSWLLVILVALFAAQLVIGAGGEDLIPQRPPAAIAWIVGLPIAVRAGLALSAGVVEELFFRGLLQPRMGIAVSTLLFAVAHLAYGQPFLVLGVTVLSLLYGLLVQWRQSIWAAIVAHFLFDAVQLLIVVPSLFEGFRGFWES